MDPQKIKEILERRQLIRKELEAIDFKNPIEVAAYFNENFPGIMPTEKEFFDGQLSAYESAVDRLKKEQEDAKKKKRLESITRMWDFEEMYEFALNNGKAVGKSQGFDFVIDQYNEKVFELLCLYFTNDKRFEENGIGDKKYSLQKGIWLQSSERGTGKSILLRCFYINKRCSFGYKHTRELSTLFQKNGFEAIDPFIGLMPVPPSAMTFYQPHCGFMYDELFGEPHVNHMGSPLQISDYILNRLYDFSDNKKDEKWKFHCTSNFDGNDIENKSGLTYRSRMPDMFNLIKLEGPDRRKK